MSEDNVVPIRRCRRCGGRARPVDIQYRGDTLFTVDACHHCVDACEMELQRVRPIFDAMIAAGVGREIANETMTFMLELVDGSFE